MKKTLLFLLLGILLLVMVATGALVVFDSNRARGAERLDYGQEIEIDDFAFAALGSGQAKRVGALDAAGIFYTVEFRVSNNAKRIGFTFRPDTAVLVDGNGTEYHVSEPARSAWFSATGEPDACARELKPGEVCVTTLVFDVPASARAPYLKMSFGGRFFEIADALMYGNRVIQLK
jgi:hypothetical protein